MKEPTVEARALPETDPSRGATSDTGATGAIGAIRDFFRFVFMTIGRTALALKLPRVWILAVLAASGFAISRFDPAVAAFVDDARERWPWVADVARNIGYVGQLEYSTLGLSLVLWLVARRVDSARLRQAARAVLGAGLLAGLAVSVLRPLIGRTRPNVGTPYAFAPLTIEPDNHSLPSGHASTSMASATALTAVLGKPAAPALALGLAVCVSRVFQRKHYPSDVFAGILLGVWIGLAAARAARRGTG